MRKHVRMEIGKEANTPVGWDVRNVMLVECGDDVVFRVADGQVIALA
jgi:hypothetical protein